jgi:hypothetical protein
MCRFNAASLLLVLAGLVAIPRALAEDNTARPENSRQIDRFEAIRLLQSSLKSNPKDTAGWVVLAELAHEVASDLSSQDDEPYYRLSAEAYEKAVALQPNNTTLRAAADFAQDELAGVRQRDQRRREAARAYVESREHELVAARFSPAVLTYPHERALAPPTTPRAMTVSRETVPAAAPLPVPEPSTPAPTAPATVAAAAPAVAYQPLATAVYQRYYAVTVQPYAYSPYAGTYVYSSYRDPSAGAAPGMHGAHRRRSER